MGRSGFTAGLALPTFAVDVAGGCFVASLLGDAHSVEHSVDGLVGSPVESMADLRRIPSVPHLQSWGVSSDPHLHPHSRSTDRRVRPRPPPQTVTYQRARTADHSGSGLSEGALSLT